MERRKEKGRERERENISTSFLPLCGATLCIIKNAMHSGVSLYI